MAITIISMITDDGHVVLCANGGNKGTCPECKAPFLIRDIFWQLEVDQADKLGRKIIEDAEKAHKMKSKILVAGEPVTIPRN